MTNEFIYRPQEFVDKRFKKLSEVLTDTSLERLYSMALSEAYTYNDPMWGEFEKSLSVAFDQINTSGWWVIKDNDGVLMVYSANTVAELIRPLINVGHTFIKINVSPFKIFRVEFGGSKWPPVAIRPLKRTRSALIGLVECFERAVYEYCCTDPARDCFEYHLNVAAEELKSIHNILGTNIVPEPESKGGLKRDIQSTEDWINVLCSNDMCDIHHNSGTLQDRFDKARSLLERN